MRLHLICILCLATALPLTAAKGEFATEHADSEGVTNPSDFSWRYYREAIKRFPERIGIICHAAYLLDKTDADDDVLMFMTECANHGSVAAMIYIASLYENGLNNDPPDYEKSAKWLHRAANTKDEAGYCYLGAYHYGVALAEGKGINRNLQEAKLYLERAAEIGIPEAVAYLDSINKQETQQKPLVPQQEEK